jgi:hypothetical protein
MSLTGQMLFKEAQTMEFKITEAQARAMARFEEEAGCDISAGRDYGANLGHVMALALHQVDHGKLIELLSQQVGSLLSQEEVAEVAADFQAQIQKKVAEKLANRKSA